MADRGVLVLFDKFVVLGNPKVTLCTESTKRGSLCFFFDNIEFHIRAATILMCDLDTSGGVFIYAVFSRTNTCADVRGRTLSAVYV